ncbi:ASKHA domain-containing protein [Desulfotomaculum sp. 1211_IL3151]|uniref:ASKHA domain-containing protein n=1 Tax=Desulfotomaculum sp. 1211_IL3151 TaxID=3084055 RepID=UPI002FDB30E3
MDKIEIVFQPMGKSIEVSPGTTVFDAARLLGIDLAAPCGGTGRCGKCLVKVLPSDTEGQWVLACQTPIDQAGTVEVPASGELVILAEGHAQGIPTDPAFVVEKNGELKHRAGVFVEKFEWDDPPLGLAVDIGTTTMVSYLYDLFSGKRLAVASLRNGQYLYGADVISRLSHALTGEANYQNLRSALVAGLNSLALSCAQEAQVNPEQIREIVMVGNTPMIHILLQLPLHGLANAPFQPYAKGPFYKTAEELGLTAVPKAVCYLPPLIGGFVGSDALAACLAQGFSWSDETKLLVDIGTNGEILLQKGAKFLAASAPAGPALEGGNIKHGMVARSGAIDKVTMDFDVHASVIGGGRAEGICGSGLVDALAEMLRLGIVDSSGRIQGVEELSPVISFKIKQRLKTHPERAVNLTKDIFITQQDIREVQLAKAAVAAAIKVILTEASIAPEDITELKLAGGFGNYLDPANAQRIGLLNGISLAKVQQVGNAAGIGSIRMLLSYGERLRAENMQKAFKHLELAMDERYQGLFLDQINFPNKEYERLKNPPDL